MILARMAALSTATQEFLAAASVLGCTRRPWR